MNSERSQSLDNLRRELGSLLIRTGVITPSGISTGWKQMDKFLVWGGFPKAAVSLMISSAGGATTLWQRSASLITQRGQWVAWVNGPCANMNPWSLRQRNVNLSKVLSISAPKNQKQTLWALQELMSSCLFEMIGCDLGATTLRDSHVRHLKKLAVRYQTALVLFTSAPSATVSSFYSLVMEFSNEHVVLHRALHRPTPQLFERRDLYADTLPQLAPGHQAISG